MAGRIVLGGKTAGSNFNLGTELDPMTADLYGIADYLQTPAYTGALWKLLIDANGNAGLGVVPSFASGRYAMQFGPYGSIDGNGGSGIEISSNAYYSSGWKYLNNAVASQYYQTTAVHAWRRAALGVADAAITWLDEMLIDATGNLLINRTAQASGGKLEVAGNVVLQPAAGAPTLTVNGDMSFQLVSNTSLKILVRGSDGVTRSTTLTLS